MSPTIAKLSVSSVPPFGPIVPGGGPPVLLDDALDELLDDALDAALLALVVADASPVPAVAPVPVASPDAPFSPLDAHAATRARRSGREQERAKKVHVEILSPPGS